MRGRRTMFIFILTKGWVCTSAWPRSSSSCQSCSSNVLLHNEWNSPTWQNIQRRVSLLKFTKGKENQQMNKIKNCRDKKQHVLQRENNPASPWRSHTSRRRIKETCRNQTPLKKRLWTTWSIKFYSLNDLTLMLTVSTMSPLSSSSSLLLFTSSLRVEHH